MDGARSSFRAAPKAALFFLLSLTVLLCCSTLFKKEEFPPRKESEKKPVFEGEQGLNLLRTVLFLRNDGIQEAFTSCEKVLAPGSHLPSAHNLMGVILWKKGDHEGAKGSWEKAHAGEPLLAAPCFNLGGYYLGRLDYSTAEGFFRKALAIDPNLTAARLNLSVAEYKLGRTEKAVEEWKALRNLPGMEDASLNLFRVTRDKEYLSALIHRLDAFSKGGLAWRHPVMMDTYLARYVEEEKKKSTYLLLQGEVLLRLGMLERGRAVLLQALNFKEAIPEARYLLGKLYMEAGRDEAALKELQDSLTAGFSEAGVFLAMAELYRKRGDWIAVESLLRGGLGSVHDETKLYLPLGEALLQLGKRDEAQGFLELSESKNPGSFETRFLLGKLFLEKGEWQLAAEEMEAALQLKGDSAEAWFLLGRILLSKGDLQAAEEALRKVHSLSQDMTEATLFLGDVLLNQGRFEEASSFFREYLKIEPESQEAEEKLRKAYRGAGVDFEEEARKALEKGEISLAVENFERALFCDLEKESLKEVLAHAAGTLGIRLLDEKNAPGAEKYLRKAAAAAPHLLKYRFTFVQALMELKDFEKARKELDAIRKLDAANPTAWEITADVLWLQKRYQESIPFLEEALRLSQKKEPVLEKLTFRTKLLAESLWIERAKGGTLFVQSRADISEYRQLDLQMKPSEGEKAIFCGAAFLISPEGYCLTSCRLAVGGEKQEMWDEAPLSIFYSTSDLILTLNPGRKDFRRLPAAVLASDKDRDLALLRFSYFPDQGEFEFLRLASSGQVRETSVTYVLGFSLDEFLGSGEEGPGPQPIITRGSIVARHKLAVPGKGSLEIFKSDARVQESSNGGPVVDEEGNVVGMVSLALPGATDEADRFSYVIASDEIKAFLMENGYGRLIQDN